MTDADIVEYLTARYDEEQRAAEGFRSRDWVARGATVRSGPRVETAGPALYSTRMMGEPWPDEICVPLPTGERPDDFWTLVNLHGATGKFESETRHAEYIAYWDPARVLADIAAKRKRLERYAAARRIHEVMLRQDAKNDAAWVITDHAAKCTYITTSAAHSSEALGILHTWEEVLRLDAAPYADRPGFRPEWKIDD